jgi:peptide-methionine (S)-S-oxide reductase
MRFKWLFPLVLMMMGFEGVAMADNTMLRDMKPDGYPVFISAGGCFWCTESEFRAQNGVLFTRVGYIGGAEENPNYEMVSAHKTKHAEAVEVTYDPAVITYEQLVEFFLTRAHDPTQLNRQGPDVGEQYRSALFPGNDDERAVIEHVIADVAARRVWKDKIVTTIEPQGTFWPAESYHQQYFEKYESKWGVKHVNDHAD